MCGQGIFAAELLKTTDGQAMYVIHTLLLFTGVSGLLPSHASYILIPNPTASVAPPQPAPTSDCAVWRQSLELAQPSRPQT
jgi:hypothetical protein